MPVSATRISMCESDPLEDDLHLAALGRELDGVGQQVPDHLLQPAGIAGDRPGVRDRASARAAMPFASAAGRHRFDRRLDERHRLQRAGRRGAACRTVIRLMSSRSSISCACSARVALDGLERALPVGFVAGAEPQHLRPAEDGVERRAQLVGERGQELVLHVAQPLGLGAGGAFAVEQELPLLGRLLRGLVEPGVVDGDGRLAGDADDQPLGRAR